MIGEYTLKNLCDKYGIDSEKIVTKNSNILTYGEYRDIDDTLNYLVNIRLLQVLAQGLLALSWGCGREPRHAGAGPNQLHTSLLGRRALGKLRV